MATTTTFYIPQALKKAEVIDADYNQDDATAFLLDDNPNTSRKLRLIPIKQLPPLTHTESGSEIMKPIGGYRVNK